MRHWWSCVRNILCNIFRGRMQDTGQSLSLLPWRVLGYQHGRICYAKHNMRNGLCMYTDTLKHWHGVDASNRIAISHSRLHTVSEDCYSGSDSGYIKPTVPTGVIWSRLNPPGAANRQSVTPEKKLNFCLTNIFFLFIKFRLSCWCRWSCGW